MQDTRYIVTLVEEAVDRTPFCVCGEPMIPVDHDGSLWLECTRHDIRATGLVDRIWSLFGHDRRLLLFADEAA